MFQPARKTPKFFDRFADVVVCLTHFPPHSHSPSLSCTVTNLTHQVSRPRVFDDYHWSSHHELCHRSRGSTSCPGRATCRCVFLSFLITLEVVTARKEKVEGAETHEMDIL